jgi:hypothetical protein
LFCSSLAQRAKQSEKMETSLHAIAVSLRMQLQARNKIQYENMTLLIHCFRKYSYSGVIVPLLDTNGVSPLDNGL